MPPLDYGTMDHTQLFNEMIHNLNSRIQNKKAQTLLNFYKEILNEILE